MTALSLTCEETDSHSDCGHRRSDGLQIAHRRTDNLGTPVSEFATRHGGLWIRTYGEGQPQIVALHGFTLHGGMWEHFAGVVDATVAAPDLPGHGHTTIKPIEMRTAVDAVAAYLSQCDSPLLIGYSQGGRVALQVAVIHPALVGKLALIATAPGLPPRERTLRRAADEGLAARIEKIGMSRFIDEWLANPLVAPDLVDEATRRADREMRLENTAKGVAAALRGMGQSAVADVSGRIMDLKMPVAFIAGGGDDKYARYATNMARSAGVRADIVPGIGHNVVREAPDAVATVVTRLLESG